MLKNIIILSLLGMSLLACINCSSKPEAVGVSYSFKEWNFYTNDSINCSFNLDSSFQKVHNGQRCYFGDSFCHTFENNDCEIAINYSFFSKQHVPYNLTELGENIINKLRDAYPKIKVEKPWIGQQGIFNAVYVTFSKPHFNGIWLVGYNDTQLVHLDIYMEGNEKVEDMKNRMQLLVESISFSIVCH